MAYWFTTQDPKVLNYGEPGVWVGKKFKDSGDLPRINEEVAIYEVGQSNNPDNKEVGAEAVVAIIRVKEIVNPPEGPDECGFFQVARGKLIASDEQGIPSKEIIKILKGINVQGKAVGSHLRSYGARVTKIDPDVFDKIWEHFTEYEIEDDYQTEVQKASPKIPSDKVQRPRYRDHGRYRELITHPELAAYCLAKSNYTCEANDSHITFTSKASGCRYVEAHHLIPLRYQPNFEFALDNPANIIALCPNCHRLLHHATIDEKKTCLKRLLTEEKVLGLKGRQIVVTTDEVFGYY